MPGNYQQVAAMVERQSAQQCVSELIARVAAKDYAALADMLTEDVVLEIFAPKSVPYHGTSRGREAVMKAIELNFSQLDGQEYRLDAVIEQDGMVAMFGHETGRVKGGRRVRAARRPLVHGEGWAYLAHSRGYRGRDAVGCSRSRFPPENREFAS